MTYFDIRKDYEIICELFTLASQTDYAEINDIGRPIYLDSTNFNIIDIWKSIKGLRRQSEIE